MLKSRSNCWILLCAILLLSGAAGLVYEIVWFQLLHLTIGSGSRSVGVLLACYMGGLFLGSLSCGRLVRRGRNPVRVYAALELGIGGFALLLPHVLLLVRSSYFALADSPAVTFLMQTAISAVLLLPPTMAMGATLPILARAVRRDESAGQRLGWIYAANLVGAVAGVFIAVQLLLPWLGLVGTNLLAVGANLLAAAMALMIARFFADEQLQDSDPVSAENKTAASDFPILLVYALNGLVSLSFQVVAWRWYSLLLGATTYAFGLMLCVFLAGLGIGSIIGSRLAGRVRNPRAVLIDVQLATAALIGFTALLVPGSTAWLSGQPLLAETGALQRPLADLLRVAFGVFPAAVGWGMTFPLAVAALRQGSVDPARSIGRLYAFNTVGAVIGALLTSFVLIPYLGSSTAAAQLIWLPLAAGLLLLLPSSLPRWTMAGGVLVMSTIAYSPLPLTLHGWIHSWSQSLGNPVYFLLIAGLPMFLGFELFLIRRSARRLTLGAMLSGLLVAVGTVVPVQVYEKGYQYSGQGLLDREPSSVVFMAEGATAAVVVREVDEEHLGLQVGGYTCATTSPPDLKHLRFLGHLPALFNTDPAEVFVVGMGAGVSGGSIALHDNVLRVQVAEIEPRVIEAAAHFARANHDALDNPKLSVVVDDGRHALARSERQFGVISTDPIAPFWMGSAALYSTEYYRLCRRHLTDGGIFMQWIGLENISESTLKSLLASFREVFPDGLLWYPQWEILLMGSTGPIAIQPDQLRQQWANNPAVVASLGEVGVADIEQLLSHLVCPLSELDDYLGSAVPVRDNNLLSQYIGWRSFANGVPQRAISKLLSHRDMKFSLESLPSSNATTKTRSCEDSRRQVIR